MVVHAEICIGLRGESARVSVLEGSSMQDLDCVLWRKCNGQWDGPYLDTVCGLCCLPKVQWTVGRAALRYKMWLVLCDETAMDSESGGNSKKAVESGVRSKSQEE